MADNSGSSNIEWKQDSGIDKKTHASRKLDMKKLAMADKKAPNQLDSGIKRVKNTTANLKKIRTKIREVFDEDEDEDVIEKPLFLNFENENQNSSLVDGLKEDEKKQLQIEQTLKNQNMQQSVGKMTAILQADQELRESGLKKMDSRTINQNMLNVVTDKQTFSNTLKEHIEEKEKIKTKNIVSYQDTKDLLKGLKKIKRTGAVSKEIDQKRIEKMEAKEIAELGKEKNEREVARTILEKTGRKGKKAHTLSKEEQIRIQNKIKETLHKQIKNKDFDRD